jgi:kynurenine--oxoglutarate transaminase/cysteine-S-conjugate beta-lyase/glutamine--phenylpyruvate transaminase
VFSRAEITAICDLCCQHDVLMISDDVYEHMVYDDSQMVRVASLPGMWDRTISIGSAGKTFSVTGWKLGWAYGPDHLIRNCGVVHQNCVYACPTPIQEAVARGFEKELKRLEDPECYFRSISRDLVSKRDFMVEMLAEVGMEPVVPQGGYFIMADWSGLKDRVDLSTETDPQADYRFVKWLTKNRGLQGIPPSAFFCQEHKAIGEDYIRFCFIKHQDSLDRARAILTAWRQELGS